MANQHTTTMAPVTNLNSSWSSTIQRTTANGATKAGVNTTPTEYLNNTSTEGAVTHVYSSTGSLGPSTDNGTTSPSANVYTHSTMVIIMLCLALVFTGLTIWLVIIWMKDASWRRRVAVGVCTAVIIMTIDAVTMFNAVWVDLDQWKLNNFLKICVPIILACILIVGLTIIWYQYCASEAQDQLSSDQKEDDVSPLLLGEHYPVTVTDDQSEFSSITLRDRPIRAVSIRANPETSDM